MLLIVDIRLLIYELYELYEFPLLSG
jgi:hypothetical protein